MKKQAEEPLIFSLSSERGERANEKNNNNSTRKRFTSSLLIFRFEWIVDLRLNLKSTKRVKGTQLGRE